MKRILFLSAFLSLLMISLTSQAQIENVIYGKTVTIKTRDTSSSELKIINSTRNTPGYLRNIGGGLTRFVLPDYSELMNKPTTFPPSSHTHGNADIIDLAWSKLTGVPDLVLVTRFIDSLVAVQGRIDTKLNITDASATYITITRTIDSLAALQGRVQTKEPLIAAGSTSQYWRGDKTWQTLDKAAVGLGNVPNTDATNASNISSGTLADARLSTNVTVQGNTFNGSNQLVKLDGSGKLPTSTIPSLALVETFVVGSQAAMLALSAQMGDVAVRTDNNRSYILQSEPATTLSNWVQLLVPDSETDPVYTASSWYSTTNNASNWNTAYSWGNHATQGYITNSTSGLVNYYTATQIQNFFSGASAMTGYNYSNWNTAFGWGNHATAGYALTSGSYANPSWITSLAWSKLTGVPSLTTGSGTSGTIPVWISASEIGNSQITQSGGTVNVNGIVKTTTAHATTGYQFKWNDTNRGGIYAYSSWIGSGTDYSTVIAAETGYGLYFFVDGSATKGFSVATTGAITTTSSLTAAGIISSSTVRPSSNYAADLGSSSIRWASIWASDANFASSVTASSYTGAGTGLNGYASGLSIGGYSTSLNFIGVSSSVDLNSTGNALYSNYSADYFTNRPTAGVYAIVWNQDNGSGSTGFQHYYDIRHGATDYGDLHIRTRNTSGWSSWSRVLHTNNFNSYAPTLTGTGASGTWGINITGNAATVTGISYDTELGWYFSGPNAYLKTAAFQDANQNLRTDANVTFNQVNATITGSVGTNMGSGILSGTQTVLRLNIGGTYYYFVAYPTFSPPQP